MFRIIESRLVQEGDGLSAIKGSMKIFGWSVSFWVFVGATIWSGCLAAQENREGTPIRVACVGDSITAGARVDADTESYPAQLQRLLGSDYIVENFGLGGATLLKSGRPNVWQRLDDVLSFEPEVVVISLGTNDTVGGQRRNWENIAQFESDYIELIDQLSRLATRPQLVLCTPTSMVLTTPGLAPERHANLTERKPRLQALCRQVRDLVARQAGKKVSLLELNGVLEDRPDWLTEQDGVHPNALGYLAIAEAVATAVRDLTQPRSQPNIVLFLVDDMGWQDTSVPFHTALTPLNRQYHTPHMERLAASGMTFTQAYACSVCSPTRVSLMTGLNAARHRVTNWTLRQNASNDARHPVLEFPRWNVNGLSPVPDVERTVHVRALPEWLRSVGYRTIHVGKAHFAAAGLAGEDPRAIGFDVNVAGHAAGGPGSFLGRQNFSAVWRGGDKIWDVPGLEKYHGKDLFLTEALTQEALRAVNDAVGEEKPFFLYMAHYAVHVPFAEDRRFYQKYRDAGLEHVEAMYAAMVEGMDDSLGEILDRIERPDLRDNTIVLFMSDNGGLSAHGRGGERHSHNRPLSSGKGSAHEGGVRVPMMVRWPGVTSPGVRCQQPVMIEDFYPTVLNLAGVDHPTQIGGVVDGMSFVSLLRGAHDSRRDNRPLYWHFPNNWGPQGPGIGASSAVRTGDWKLIHYYDGRPTELFDLSRDLGERTNRADLEPRIRRRLQSQLANYLQEVGAQFPIDRESGRVLVFQGE